jgi:hypothetical protein
MHFQFDFAISNFLVFIIVFYFVECLLHVSSRICSEIINIAAEIPKMITTQLEFFAFVNEHQLYAVFSR